MSDIALNALRYNPTNTARSDMINFHNGQEVDKQDNGEAIIGFDCSGFVCHVIIESGYRVDYETTSELLVSKSFTTTQDYEAQPGDIILFDGHVGIVTEYDQSTTLGRFIHMSGNSERGGHIKISYFVANEIKFKTISNQTESKTVHGPDHATIYYGTSRKVKGLRRVSSNRYSAEVDLHRNSSNPHPILRPLGTQIYSKHRLRTAQDQKRIIESRNSLPSPRPLKRKAIPHRVGYTTLMNRFWGKLTEGNLADYE